MNTLLTGSIKEHKVHRRLKNWQRYLPEQLPHLFYAFNNKPDTLVTNRVISFKLPDDDFRKIVQAYKGLKKINENREIKIGEEIRIYMASKKKSTGNSINKSPHFSPIFAVEYFNRTNEDEIVLPTNCFFPMNWVPGSPANLDKFGYSDSGTDAISPAAASMLLKGWLECSVSGISTCFEAVTQKYQRQRVKFYTYSNGETKALLENAKKALNDEIHLLMHLGVGEATEKHPFIFRPILELQIMSKKEDTTETDSTYFEFSAPCPPYCN